MNKQACHLDRSSLERSGEIYEVRIILHDKKIFFRARPFLQLFFSEKSIFNIFEYLYKYEFGTIIPFWESINHFFFVFCYSSRNISSYSNV